MPGTRRTCPATAISRFLFWEGVCAITGKRKPIGYCLDSERSPVTVFPPGHHRAGHADWNIVATSCVKRKGQANQGSGGQTGAGEKSARTEIQWSSTRGRRRGGWTRLSISLDLLGKRFDGRKQRTGQQMRFWDDPDSRWHHRRYRLPAASRVRFLLRLGARSHFSIGLLNRRKTPGKNGESKTFNALVKFWRPPIRVTRTPAERRSRSAGKRLSSTRHVANFGA